MQDKYIHRLKNTKNIPCSFSLTGILHQTSSATHSCIPELLVFTSVLHSDDNTLMSIVMQSFLFLPLGIALLAVRFIMISKAHCFMVMYGPESIWFLYKELSSRRLESFTGLNLITFYHTLLWCSICVQYFIFWPSGSFCRYCGSNTVICYFIHSCFRTSLH